MENIYKGSKTILLFLIIVFVIQTSFGDKVAQNMCLMILFSMLLLNSSKLSTYVKNITDNLTANT